MCIIYKTFIAFRKYDRPYFKIVINFVIQFIGLVAQLVEQRTENPCVGGSIPPRATCKTLVNSGVFWIKKFIDD